MNRRLIVLAAATALALMPQMGGAQKRAENVLPEEARKRLEHTIGTWDCRWDYLDAEGNVTASVKGTEKATWLMEGRVVQMTTQIEGREHASKAWMFYDFAEESFNLTSVDRDGSLWILKGGLDEFVITSLPRRQPNGRMMTIRFTHMNVEEDAFEAHMEFSRDGGKTWRLGFREYLKRRS